MKNGVIEWRSLASLKASVIVAFIVLWNAGCLVGVYLNGGFGQLTNRASAFAIVVTFVAASLFALTVALSTGAQDILLAESRRHNFLRRDFLFIAFLAGFIAVGILFTTVR